MIDQTVLIKFSQADPDAIRLVKSDILNADVPARDICNLWDYGIAGIMNSKNKQARDRLVISCGELLDFTKDPVHILYECLYGLATYKGGETGLILVTKVGAAVSRIRKNEISAKGFDSETYLNNAKMALQNALKCEDPAIKELAAGVLARFDETQRITLISLDCVVEDKLHKARMNREFLAETYIDQETPQRGYVELIYRNIEIIFDERQTAKAIELATARLQTIGNAPGRYAEKLFVRQHLDIIKADVGTAILHSKEKCSNGRITPNEWLDFPHPRSSRTNIQLRHTH